MRRRTPSLASFAIAAPHFVSSCAQSGHWKSSHTSRTGADSLEPKGTLYAWRDDEPSTVFGRGAAGSTVGKVTEPLPDYEEELLT